MFERKILLVLIIKKKIFPLQNKTILTVMLK